MMHYNYKGQLAFYAATGTWKATHSQQKAVRVGKKDD